MKKKSTMMIVGTILLSTQLSAWANIPFYVANLSNKNYSMVCNTSLGGVVKVTPTRGIEKFYVLNSSAYRQASESNWSCVVIDPNGATASKLQFLLPNYAVRATHQASSLLFTIGINGSLSYTEQKRG